MTAETRFSIDIDPDDDPRLDPDDPDFGMNPGEGVLSVKVTDEGIICDVENAKGEVIATWGATAQEMADEYCYLVNHYGDD